MTQENIQKLFKDIASALDEAYRRGYETAKVDIISGITTLSKSESDRSVPAPSLNIIHIEDVSKPVLTTVSIAKEPEVSTPTNLRIKSSPSPRPKNIPTTFVMVATILLDTPELTAREVADKIRARWWPDMDFNRIGPEFSTWIGGGRLARDRDGKLTLTWAGHDLAFPGQPNPYPVPPKPVAPQVKIFPTVPLSQPAVPMPSVQPAGPEPQGIRYGNFEHAGAKVQMHHREYMMATKLRLAMGKGHLDVNVMANAVLGSAKRGAVDDRSLLRELAAMVNEKIERLNLKIEFFEGYGFLMKEISGVASAAE